MVWPKGKPRDPATIEKIRAAGLGRKHTEETKERQAAWHRGRPRAPETVEKIRQARLAESRTLQGEARRARFASRGFQGKKHSPESLAKMGMARRGKRHTPETIAKLRTKRVSAETKAKMSQAAKQRTVNSMQGRHHSEETKAKMRGRVMPEEAREKLRNRVFSPETREKMRQSAVRRHALLCALGQVKATAPERKVAAMLEAEGRAFIAQHPIGPFVVDYFLPDENTVIEVQGCFWHGCARCGHGERHPKQQSRDRRKAAYLRKQGHTFIAIWEHDLR